MTERIWTRREETVLTTMVGQGASNATIAKAIDRSQGQVAGKIRRLGLSGLRGPRRKDWYRFKEPQGSYSRTVFAMEARRRRISVFELESRILDVVAREKLVGAILDDAAEAAE